MPPTQSTGNENERNTQTGGFLAAADGEMGTENRPAAADGGGIERAGGLLARACCAGAGCIHGIPNRKAACTREFGAVEQGAHAGIVFLGQLVRDLPAHVARYPAPARRWRARAGRGGAFGQPSGSARLPATAPLDLRYAERRTRRLVAGMAGEGNADHRAGATGQSDTQHYGAGELLGLEAARGVGRCVGGRQMVATHGKQKILHEVQPGGCAWRIAAISTLSGRRNPVRGYIKIPKSSLHFENGSAGCFFAWFAIYGLAVQMILH